MAITKILNIMESEDRNPASHLKNALEYIQNPDKTEECVLVGGINCLPDTAFEQMEETKNIFHKTGKRQGYHVIISFSPEEKVSAEQAMYVLEHFAKDLLGDDYEAVYAVHTDREHMHGHLIWNSVSMTTGKKYNSPKSNWKNHLQPITNKYCDELGLSILPAEYSRNPKNISRDKWEREMSMKEIILRDAKMCAYAAGNVEHFKYLMKRLGYVFRKNAWMEVQAPGFKYYHQLAKLDEMFSEDMLRHYVDMPWMAKPYFYSSDIRGLHRAKLSPYQKKFYAKLYRLRIVEQKRFEVGGAKYTEDLKRFHQLQDEYLLLVNNDIKSVVELVDFIGEQKEKIRQIEDRQHEIYRESSSWKRSIKNEEQYREYQIWHVEVQEELDGLKQEKREIKRQIKLADDIIKEDLYTAYYAVSGKEEIVADRDVEIPGMEKETVSEKDVAVEPETNVEVVNPDNNQNDTSVMPDIRNVSDVNTARMDEDITDVKQIEERLRMKERTKEMQMIMDQGQGYVDKIHESNDIIKDKIISQKLDRMRNLIAVRTGSEYSPRPDEKDTSGKCTDNATKQWKEIERAHFRKICIKHGLTVDGEIKTPERDSLSILEYKAEMRKREIKKLETQEKELRVMLRNLQRLIKQAEEKLEEAKKEATNIIESAKVKVNEWLEKINLRLGLIPKKDIEDKRRELVGYYKACEPYLTNDMRIAINNEDVKGFGALVSRLTASNPDGTVARRNPGWEELFDFEIKYEEYLEMKNKNVKTEDIIKELEQPKRVSMRKR